MIHGVAHGDGAALRQGQRAAVELGGDAARLREDVYKRQKCGRRPFPAARPGIWKGMRELFRTILPFSREIWYDKLVKKCAAAAAGSGAKKLWTSIFWNV